MAITRAESLKVLMSIMSVEYVADRALDDVAQRSGHLGRSVIRMAACAGYQSRWASSHRGRPIEHPRLVSRDAWAQRPRMNEGRPTAMGTRPDRAPPPVGPSCDHAHGCAARCRIVIEMPGWSRSGDGAHRARIAPAVRTDAIEDKERTWLQRSSE